MSIAFQFLSADQLGYGSCSLPPASPGTSMGQSAAGPAARDAAHEEADTGVVIVGPTVIHAYQTTIHNVGPGEAAVSLLFYGDSATVGTVIQRSTAYAYYAGTWTPLAWSNNVNSNASALVACAGGSLPAGAAAAFLCVPQFDAKPPFLVQGAVGITCPAGTQIIVSPQTRVTYVDGSAFLNEVVCPLQPASGSALLNF